MAQAPKSMAEMEGRAPYDERLRRRKLSEIDPLGVQPASQPEIPADDDPLAHAGGSAVG